MSGSEAITDSIDSRRVLRTERRQASQEALSQKATREGKEPVLQSAASATPSSPTLLLQTGEHFGELALIDGAPRAATVVSTEKLTTVCIRRAAFHRLLRQEPAIAVGLLPSLVRIIRESQADAADSL